VGPIYAAAVWINRYSKYWQEQFGMLAAVLEDVDERKQSRVVQRKRRRTRRQRAS
jgi:hypothetical protein